MTLNDLKDHIPYAIVDSLAYVLIWWAPVMVYGFFRLSWGRKDKVEEKPEGLELQLSLLTQEVRRLQATMAEASVSRLPPETANLLRLDTANQVRRPRRSAASEMGEDPKPLRKKRVTAPVEL